MATIELQTTAELAESRRKMQAKRRLKKPDRAGSLNGDDGIRSVLAYLDPHGHGDPRY
ncbi:phosphate transporter permease subunit PtsA [Raoultella terrigena]|uniref:Phosphate transporter permease subunit PtsA n=1 Tax=Raoultella terrigena TaxID=577 RepID=A0A7Z9CV70_RAOTE|nr:phosphate transporter permease subunit PtsA [Raoultella terrigena]